MLNSIHAENIAVIKSIDIDISEGFTVLTGETGAGKSILIDAIGMVLGNKTSKEIIRFGCDKALVSAVFSDFREENLSALKDLGIEPDEDGYIYVERTLSSDGKGQSRINGRAVPVALHREAGKYLINIHGQHENQMLLDEKNHRIYLDRFADLTDRLAQYKELYQDYKAALQKLENLKKTIAEQEQFTDLMKYQVNEIDSAKLTPGEDEKLEEKKAKLKNITIINKSVKSAYSALYGSESGSAFETIGKAVKALKNLSGIIPESAGMAEKLESFRYEIEDIAERTNSLFDDDDDIANPDAALDRLNDRLELINSLKRKYGGSIDSVLKTLSENREKLNALEDSDFATKELEEQVKEKLDRCNTVAKEISAIRKEKAKLLEGRVMEELEYLEMSGTSFVVNIENATELSANGIDEVSFLIATNKGEKLSALEKIASGGELSRIMLAIKCVLADRENTETMIYDEIDTGISGKTSYKLGIKLRESAKCGQVLCVTHSAQIAATAENHLFISKSEINQRTETNVTSLDFEDHIKEVARIMGGEKITESILASARELCEQNK